MANFLRKTIGLVMCLALVAPLATVPGVSAQTTLDGSQCWQPGQLGISGAQMSWPVPPATIIDQTQQYSAVLQTSVGTIEITLDALNAPLATNNFICLALAGYYTGSDFYRVFGDSLIQGGDPTNSGAGYPGYRIASDPTTGNYPAGSVAMANAQPNQNGSQFFIAVSDLTGLIPNDYPVFGYISSGLDVVRTISQGAVVANASGEISKPIDPIILLDVRIQEGTGQTPSEGPAISTPTPDLIEPPTATPFPTATIETSTAQGRPGHLPFGPTATSAPIVSDCTGLDEYEKAFDDAYFGTALQNGDALSFLLSLQENDSSQSIFEMMTSDQASAMSTFYYALADALTEITPPPFAAEWHDVQVDVFRALGEFTGNIATQGLTLASIQASGILTDLSSQDDAALANAAAVCADFQTWASGEGA